MIIHVIRFIKFRKIIRVIILIAIFGICFAPAAQAAVMSSSNYKIQIDSVNVGGGRATSSNYALENTTGEAGTGKITGTSNNLFAGFQLPVVAATPTPSPVVAGVSSAGTRRAQGQLLNVENFTATGVDQQVQLRWNNPLDIDFLGVRIMRSEEFYPSTPSDGLLIYDGAGPPAGEAGQEFLDKDLQNGRAYYYTAFSYDRFGNFSSGAIAFAIPYALGVYPPPVEGPPSPGEPVLGEPPLVPPDQVPPELVGLAFLDFDFIQRDSKLPAVNGRIEADADSPFTIAIDYDKLPEVLKTILVTMKDYEGKVFSFLMRVDEEKERYLATLHPPASGVYGLSFVVVDYQNQGLRKVTGELEVKTGGAVQAVPPAGEGFGRFLPQLLLFLIVVLLLIIAAKLARKYIDHRLKPVRYIGCLILGLFLLQVLSAGSASAAFNTQINYQGKLTDTSNNAVSDGDYNFKFRLCITVGCTDASDPIWTETREGTDKVTVTSGIFSVLLGSVTSIASVNFNQSLWFEVQVGGTGGTPSYETLTPRKKLGAVSAAFEADKLDGLDSTAFLRASNNLSDLSATSTAIGNLGLTIGTDTQAYDDELRDVASSTPTKGDILTSDGTDWLDFAVGTDGYLLTASSTASNGIAWDTGYTALDNIADPTASSTIEIASTTLTIDSAGASSTFEIDGDAGRVRIGGGLTPVTAPTAGRTITTVDTSMVSGTRSSIYCISSTDCKIAYKDDNSDLVMADCDDATCSTKTLTVVDNVAADTGSWPSIYCVTATDCKIAYYDVTNTNLKMADCDNATCSVVTLTTVDGNTSADTGEHAFIFCPGGDGSDCKIAHQDNTNNDLIFVDCGNATCSTNSTTTVDSVTSANTGDWLSMYCVTATDCKISYYDTTNTNLMMADCDDATCSVVTLTTVDSATSASTGAHTAIYCLSSTDCKIAYVDTTNFDLLLADCDDATCSVKTLTAVDRKAVRENVTAADHHVDMYCVTATDCKISYEYDTDDNLVVTDCNNATCSERTRVEILPFQGSSSGSGLGTSIYCLSSTDCKITNRADSDLKLVDCDTSACSAASGTDLGSLSLYFANVYADTYFQKQSFIGFFDLAEDYFVHDVSIEAGDIVAIAGDQTGASTGATGLIENKPFVEKSATPYQANVIGVVSTKPGILLSDWQSADTTPKRPVALAGRVPVKVSLENGPIVAGDAITSSSVAGVGMSACGRSPEGGKATTCRAGRVVGIALENFGGASEGESSAFGKILVFVNPHWSMGALDEKGLLAGVDGAASASSTSPPPTFAEATAGEGGFMELVRSAIESFTGTVKTAGEWVFERISAKTVRVEKIELVDQETGELYCTWLENGEWVKVQGECDNQNSQFPISPPTGDLPQGDNETNDQNSNPSQTEPVGSSDPTAPSDDGAEPTPEPEPAGEEPVEEPITESGSDAPNEEPVRTEEEPLPV